MARLLYAFLLFALLTNTTANGQCPGLSIALTTSPIPCHGQAGGAIHTVLSGGSGNFTFLWNTGSTASELLNLVAGTYTVTVTDVGQACSTTASYVLTEPPALHVAITSVTGFCGAATGSITVQASGGTPPYTYIWNTHNYFVGPTLSNVPPGNFYVCVRDANGCQMDLPFSINSAPNNLAVQLIETSAQCTGQANGTVTAVVTPPGGNFYYSWNIPGAGNVPQLTGLAAGTNVSVTVTDFSTGCTATASTSISAHNQIHLQVTDVDIPCGGGAIGSATATATLGTAPYDFAWQVNGQTIHAQTITNLPVGAYSLLVTDAVGCTAASGADITSLGNISANLSVNGTDCIGSSVPVSFQDLSSSPGSPIVSWNWHIVWSNGQVNSNQQTPPTQNLSDGETGTAQLTVTNADGCTASVSQPFTVSALPSVQIGITLPVKTCDGQPVHIPISGNPAYTYQWSPLAGLDLTNPFDVIANPGQATTYILLVTNGAGCSKSYSIPVQIGNAPTLAALADLTTCDLSVTLTANANAPVSWYSANGLISSNSTVNVIPGAPANFWAVATNADGCTASDTLTVTGTGADLQIAAAPLPACAGVQVQLISFSTDPTDINTYLWTCSNPNLNIHSPTNPVTQVDGPAGTYTVTITATNQHNCTSSKTVTVMFNDGTSLAGLLTWNSCDGTNVSFHNNSGQPGTWNFGDGATSTDANPTHQYATTGNFDVSFTPNSSCVVKFDSTIQVQPAAAILANFGKDLKNCDNKAVFNFTDSTTHTAQIATWAWAFPPTLQTANGQNPTVTFTQNGPITATLIVTDVNGCKDTTSQDIPFHIVVENVLNNLGFCDATQPTALNPNGNPSYTYDWTSTPPDPNLDPTAPNPTVSPTVSTTYSVTITSGGCVVEKKAVINLTVISDDIEPNHDLCDAGTAVQLNPTFDPTYTYVWTSSPLDPTLQTNSPNPSVNPSFATTYTVTITVSGANGTCTAVHTTTVSPNPLSANIAPSYDLCDSLGVDLNPNFNPAYTYVWTAVPTDATLDPNAPNPHVNPSVATTYTVAVSLGACNLEKKVTVTPGQISASIEPHHDLCDGQPVALNPNFNPAWTYHWTAVPPDPNLNANAPNPTVNPSVTTTYTVAISNGICSKTLSTTVDPNSLSFALDNQHDICDSATVALNPNGNPNYTYHWTAVPADPNLDANAVNPVVSPSVPTTYFVNVGNGNCSKVDSTVVTPYLISEDIDPTHELCFGQTAIPLNPVFDPKYTYHWSASPPDPNLQTLNPNPSVSPAVPTTYTLTVGFGTCVKQFSTMVTPITINDDLAAKKGFCPGDSVQLNPGAGAGQTYTWGSNPVDPNLDPTAVNPTVSPSVPTLYWVEIKNSTCLKFDSTLVTPFVAAAGKPDFTDKIVCSDMLVTLGVSGNGTFQWFHEPGHTPVGIGATVSVNPGRDDIFTVVTTTADGCTDLDSVKLNDATVGISFQKDWAVCLGNSVTLDIQNAFPQFDNLTFKWTPTIDPAVPNPTVTPTDDADYQAIVSNQHGCADTASIHLDVVKIAATATTDMDSLCPGKHAQLGVTASGGTNYTYLWEPASSLDDATSATPIASPTESTTYTVTVTTDDALKCSATAVVHVHFIDLQCKFPFIFVPNVFTPNGDSKNETFRVRHANVEEMHFMVFDRWGEKMYDTTDPNHTGWDGTFDGKQVTADSYGWYLTVKCAGGETYTTKGDVTLIK